MNDISQDMFFIWIVIRKVSHKVTISVFMMTSSNENISTLLALCAGNPPVTGEPPSQKASDAELWCFNDLRLNKRLSEQSRHRWFETSSLSLWRHGENYSVTVTLPEHLKSPTIHLFFQRFVLTNDTKKAPPLRITGFLWTPPPQPQRTPLTKDQWCGMRFSCLGAIMKMTATWWRHQIETFSALLAICAGNSPVPGEFPAQRPVTRSFDVFFNLHPNKRLSKRWWGWLFETPPCPLWRHRNELSIVCCTRTNLECCV